MLIASLSIGPAAGAPVRRLAWRAMLILAGAVAGTAVWFTIVQKWVIAALCPYCMATHITGLMLAALVMWRAPKEFEDDSPDMALNHSSSKGCPRQVTGGSLAISLTVFGLVLAGMLAVCQVTLAPASVHRGGEAQHKLPAMDPHDVPLVGSPGALYVVNLLFDYKCPHCQEMHFLLNEAIRRYSGKLAFALCPTPLNRQCNRYIPRDVDEFKDSCELAEIGLAVWVANRETFPAFDNWMFSFESGDRWHPRTLDAARAKAVELIGEAKFVYVRTNSWIDWYMQTSIGIYADTIQSGNGAIPKLVFGSRWVIPEPRDATDLILILQDSLAVPKP
jgi:hypothetical protein